MEFYVRNVNEAFRLGASLFAGSSDYLFDVAPRGKRTLEAKEPFITHYEKPRERVLFDAVRDCNPFLHFFESLWLLAGRDDLKFMEYLAPQFREYSDDGKQLQGSYGERWRSRWGLDQLKYLVTLLKEDPSTRRAVLTMWSPRDLISQGSKDIPCNTQVYFKIRDGRLNMTVTCRSNDMIWGAYGANAVQFSMLQEYIANKLEIGVGRYTQLSDSFHVYLDGKEGAVAQRVLEASKEGLLNAPCPYQAGQARPLSLGAGHPKWDADLARFFTAFDENVDAAFDTIWWERVAGPMWSAFVHYKEKDYAGARMCADHIAAPDWALNVKQWLERHSK